MNRSFFFPNFISKNISFFLCASVLFLAACDNEKLAKKTEFKDFEIVKYNSAKTTSFLGVGLWAWPLPNVQVPHIDQDVKVNVPGAELVDWNKDGFWEILVGAEDGHFYHYQR